MSLSRGEQLVNTGQVESIVNELLQNPRIRRLVPTFKDRPFSDLMDSANLVTRVVDGTQWKGNPRLVLLDRQELLKRAQNLDDLFRSPRWKSRPNLLAVTSERITCHAAQLTEYIDRDLWFNDPTLLILNPETVKQRIENLRSMFGDDTWRRDSSIIMQPIEKTRKMVTIIEDNIGEAWRRYPSILHGSESDLLQSIESLTALFPEGQWKRKPMLLRLNGQDILESAETLNSIFGEEWKRYPQMLEVTNHVKTNVSEIDAIFGEYKWRKYPQIAMQSISTLTRYASDHTQRYGSDKWKASPPLITVTPATFNTTLIMFKNVGLNPENASGHINGLLSTTLQLKRRKIKLIREEILHHKNVFIFTEGQSLAELVNFRRLLTDEQIRDEAQEIDETIAFLRSRLYLFKQSESSIREWGKKKGYIT